MKSTHFEIFLNLLNFGDPYKAKLSQPWMGRGVKGGLSIRRSPWSQKIGHKKNQDWLKPVFRTAEGFCNFWFGLFVVF